MDARKTVTAATIPATPLTPAAHQPSGAHLLADFYGVAPAQLCDAAAIERVLRQSAQAAGAEIIFAHFHSFGAGHGVTGVLLLAESHISIHTWPENSFAAADIFMCGTAKPQRALAFMQHVWQPASCSVQLIARGGDADTNPTKQPDQPG
jgi:S-adenosylmethionine decarboxylase